MKRNTSVHRTPRTCLHMPTLAHSPVDVPVPRPCDSPPPGCPALCAQVQDELRRLDDPGATISSLDPIKLVCLSKLCAVSQTFGYAGREDVARTVFGAAGRLLKRDMPEVEHSDPVQKLRARGYASKLHQIVEDVCAAPADRKTLVIIHRCAARPPAYHHKLAALSPARRTLHSARPIRQRLWCGVQVCGLQAPAANALKAPRRRRGSPRLPARAHIRRAARCAARPAAWRSSSLRKNPDKPPMSHDELK